MKNVNILPTRLASRLIHNVLGYGMITNEFTKSDLTLIQAEYKNIYITNDEEIKEGDWYCHNQINYLRVSNSNAIPMDAKKIILTTDIDLIKDGVQAIDDEFLEWFIKNPSCENVKVEKDEFYSKKAFIEGKNAITYEYKIIIPKEKPKQVWKQIIETCGGKEVFMESAGLKPKQETLEESSKRLCLNTKERVGFYKCYSWQQEQDKNKYSEEDMIKAVMFGELYQTEGSKSLFERKGTTPSQALVDFIDSFKKK